MQEVAAFLAFTEVAVYEAGYLRNFEEATFKTSELIARNIPCGKIRDYWEKAVLGEEDFWSISGAKNIINRIFTEIKIGPDYTTVNFAPLSFGDLRLIFVVITNLYLSKEAQEYVKLYFGIDRSDLYARQTCAMKGFTGWEMGQMLIPAFHDCVDDILFMADSSVIGDYEYASVYWSDYYEAAKFYTEFLKKFWNIE